MFGAELTMIEKRKMEDSTGGLAVRSAILFSTKGMWQRQKHCVPLSVEAPLPGALWLANNEQTKDAQLSSVVPLRQSASPHQMRDAVKQNRSKRSICEGRFIMVK